MSEKNEHSEENENESDVSGEDVTTTSISITSMSEDDEEDNSLVDENEKLKKQNSDLQSQIFMLEKTLNLTQSPIKDSEILKENVSLRLDVEKQEMINKQKNDLLRKAKDSINVLRRELHVGTTVLNDSKKLFSTKLENTIEENDELKKENQTMKADCSIHLNELVTLKQVMEKKDILIQEKERLIKEQEKQINILLERVKEPSRNEQFRSEDGEETEQESSGEEFTDDEVQKENNTSISVVPKGEAIKISQLKKQEELESAMQSLRQQNTELAKTVFLKSQDLIVARNTNSTFRQEVRKISILQKTNSKLKNRIETLQSIQENKMQEYISRESEHLEKISSMETKLKFYQLENTGIHNKLNKMNNSLKSFRVCVKKNEDILSSSTSKTISKMMRLLFSTRGEKVSGVIKSIHTSLKTLRSELKKDLLSKSSSEELHPNYATPTSSIHYHGVITLLLKHLNEWISTFQHCQSTQSKSLRGMVSNSVIRTEEKWMGMLRSINDQISTDKSRLRNCEEKLHRVSKKNEEGRKQAQRYDRMEEEVKRKVEGYKERLEGHSRLKDKYRKLYKKYQDLKTMYRKVEKMVNSSVMLNNDTDDMKLGQREFGGVRTNIVVEEPRKANTGRMRRIIHGNNQFLDKMGYLLREDEDSVLI